MVGLLRGCSNALKLTNDSWTRKSGRLSILGTVSMTLRGPYKAPDQGKALTLEFRRGAASIATAPPKFPWDEILWLPLLRLELPCPPIFSRLDFVEEIWSSFPTSPCSAEASRGPNHDGFRTFRIFFSVLSKLYTTFENYVINNRCQNSDGTRINLDSIIG